MNTHEWEVSRKFSKINSSFQSIRSITKHASSITVFFLGHTRHKCFVRVAASQSSHIGKMKSCNDRKQHSNPLRNCIEQKPIWPKLKLHSVFHECLSTGQIQAMIT